MRRGLVAAAAATGTLLAAAPAHATLAYVRGLSQGAPAVWVAGDDGSNARRLAGGFAPRVSPDGAQVAYLSGRRRVDLRVRGAAGGPSRLLARNVWNYDQLQWSPDGTRLSVVTGPELGPYRLSVVTVATGASRRLARGYFHGLSFSPDGASVVFSRAFADGEPIRANLYTASLAGGGLTRITDDENATAPVWGPQRIAFNRSRPARRRGDLDKLDIYTVAPDGTERRRLTRTQVPFLLAGLVPRAWSEDGRRILAAYEGRNTSEAWRVNAETGAAADATGGFDGVAGWGLSQDGASILAATGSFGNPPGDVIAVAWDGGAPTVLARRAAQPSWSR